MTDQLPVRQPGESDTDLLNRLLVALASSSALIGAAGSGTIFDGLGRPVLVPGVGIWAYSDPTQTQYTAPVQPGLVQINTQDLVDGAVTLQQTDIPQMVLGNQAVFGDAVIITLLAGEVEAVSAEIDNLNVNNANIVSLAAGKITAGTVSANGIYVGSSNFELDGVNTKLVIRDAQTSPVTRVEIGRLGAGTTNYGITIRDPSGTIIFSSGSSTSINGAYMATASIGSAAINDLAANKITAGTLLSSVILSSQINAAQINVGTLTGFTLQTTNGVSQATTRLSGPNNRLESYDSGGNLVAAVGQLSLGGNVYATANSSLFAAGSLSNSGGGVGLSVITNGSFTGLPTVSVQNNSGGRGVSVSTGSDHALFGASSNGRGVWGESTSSNAVDGKNVGSGGGWGAIGTPGSFGGWSFYDLTGGGYGPFTAAHEGLIEKAAPGAPGDLVASVAVLVRHGWSDTVRQVAVTATAAQPGVAGMVTKRTPLTQRTAAMRDMDDAAFAALAAAYDLVVMNAIGEGQMLVCGEGGDIEDGDLIVTSSMPGKGMRQADDIVRKTTVARACEAATFSSAGESKQIACIYHCG